MFSAPSSTRRRTSGNTCARPISPTECSQPTRTSSMLHPTPATSSSRRLDGSPRSPLAAGPSAGDGYAGWYQTGFFDLERRLDALSAKGDPLETIKTTVPWEAFRADIEAVTETKPEERKSNAGRKPYDTILKFKIVVLQSLYNLSAEQTEV